MVSCKTCNKHFPSGPHAAHQHADAVGHQVELWSCHFCSDNFYEQDDLDDHYSGHNFCWDCNRQFMNRNNFEQHRRSRVHMGANMKCPFCGAGFTTATGVTHHVERGGCPKAQGMNRDMVYRALRKRDPNGLITKNLLEWRGSTEYSADPDKSWNPDRRGYECYFCSRLFSSLSALNSHLNSPAHQDNLYHCPKTGCYKEFTTLAAAINHLESESCNFMRFSDVQTNAKSILSGNRLIQF